MKVSCFLSLICVAKSRLLTFVILAMQCTVWGVGKAIERNPDVALELVRAGHEVAGHGYRLRPPFPFLLLPRPPKLTI